MGARPFAHRLRGGRGRDHLAGGATEEAYATLVHGLAMADAETLSTDDVVALLPLTALTGLAEIAQRRGEDDVAGILEAVAVVAEH